VTQVQENALLARITVNPEIFGGKPIIRGRRLAVEHVLGMLAGGDSMGDLLREYPWLERDDVQACLVYAGSSVTSESSLPFRARVREGPDRQLHGRVGCNRCSRARKEVMPGRYSPSRRCVTSFSSLRAQASGLRAGQV
jgi:uncharacterized protein (DUF433 family)